MTSQIPRRRWAQQTGSRDVLVAAAVAVAIAGCTSGTNDPATTSGSPSASAAPAPTVVTTSSGRLRGARDAEVVRFRGVPYARPPVASLRWSPPQPPARWSGVRDASASGPRCPQPGGKGVSSVNEDCLHLDVTVPSRHSRAPLPVMVWLHGGGFTSGAGSEYDPRRLVAAGNVIVVTVDFRLGVMANLAVPGMDQGGSYGLQDQRAALRWVRQSIASFGGDRSNVTLFGQSGGAVAACGQLTSPAARTLFDKAILQSGSCDTTLAANAAGPGSAASGTFWRPLATAQREGTRLASALGCPIPRTTLACLRAVPPATLLKAGTASTTAAAYGTAGLPTDPARTNPARTGPVGDGRPVLSGTTRDEQRFVAIGFALAQQPITTAKYPMLLRQGFGANAAEVAARYPAHASAALAWSAAYTDSGFVCPQLTANRRLARSAPLYAYEFADRTAPPALPAPPGFAAGASHASELFYLFDMTTGPVRIDGTRIALTAAQRRLATTTITAWTRFARTGQPGDATAWPSGADAHAHRFNAGGAMNPATADVGRDHHCDFWNAIH